MTAYPVVVEPKTLLMDAIHFMAERGFGNLVVGDDIIPKGILTEREILKSITDGKSLDDLKVDDVGWQPYVRLSLGHTVLDAAHQMSIKKSRLLVFDEDKLIGIVTASDLLRAFRKTKSESSLESVISTKIVKCTSLDSVFDSVKAMHEKRTGSVIVEDMKGYGIFTERDLLTKIVINGFSLDDKVSKHASSPLLVAPIDIKAHEAASKMSANGIKRLGLVEKGNLVGIVTARDVVDAYQSAYQISNPYLEELSEYISR